MVGGMMRDRTESESEGRDGARRAAAPGAREAHELSFPRSREGHRAGRAGGAEAELERLRTLCGVRSRSIWRGALRNVSHDTLRTRDRVRARRCQSRAPRRSSCSDRITRARRQAARRGCSWSGTSAARSAAVPTNRISYHLTTDADGGTGLEVTPIDSALGRTVFRAGLQISDDFAGSDDYQLNIGSARDRPDRQRAREWRTFVGIGRVAALSTDLYRAVRPNAATGL